MLSILVRVHAFCLRARFLGRLLFTLSLGRRSKAETLAERPSVLDRALSESCLADASTAAVGQFEKVARQALDRMA